MKYERPLRRPSQMVEGVPPEALAAQPQTPRHGGSAKTLSAHPAAPVGNSKACPPPEVPAAQPQTPRHGESAKALSAYPAAPVGNYKGMPLKLPPHNRKPRSTAGARKSDRVTLRRPSGTARHAPRSPRRTTANRAARRERRRKPRGARRRRDEASCVVPPLASGYLPLARCRLTRRNSRSAVCALRFARAA